MGAAEKMVLWDSWLRGGVAESDWANVLASRHRYLLPTNPGCCVDRLSWHPESGHSVSPSRCQFGPEKDIEHLVLGGRKRPAPPGAKERSVKRNRKVIA